MLTLDRAARGEQAGIGSLQAGNGAIPHSHGVSDKRAYSSASLHDSVVAEVLGIAFAVGLVGFALVLLAIAALPVVWVIFAAVRGMAMLWRWV